MAITLVILVGEPEAYSILLYVEFEGFFILLVTTTPVYLQLRAGLCAT